MIHGLGRLCTHFTVKLLTTCFLQNILVQGANFTYKRNEDFQSLFLPEEGRAQSLLCLCPCETQIFPALSRSKNLIWCLVFCSCHFQQFYMLLSCKTMYMYMTYRWQCPDNGSGVFSPTCHHGYQASKWCDKE